MGPVFKQMKEQQCDAISFLPKVTQTKKGEIVETMIQGLNYKEKGEPINNTEMGYFYDIILFQETEDDFVNKEHFEAILVCPYTYAERLIKEGHFGYIGKKTTTSDEVFNLFNKAIDDGLLGEIDE